MAHKCEGCVFQRYQMDGDEQKWYCRLESEDVYGNNRQFLLHPNRESNRDCIYGYGKE